jgi:hypothetical protein
MRLDEFNMIRAALASAEDSTAVDLSDGKVTAKLAGLNSPHVSHRTVEFVAAEGTLGFMIYGKRLIALATPGGFTDDRRKAVIAEDEKQTGLRCQFFEGDIPTKLVFRLLGRFGEYGLDLPIDRQDPLIRVGMARPVVIGWEKKGLKHVPVFDPFLPPEPYPEVEMAISDFRCKCGTCDACAKEKLLSEESMA